MKKIILLLLSSSVLLFGCGAEMIKDKDTNTNETIEKTESDLSKLEWDEMLDVQGVDLTDHIEYYPWEDIHFTKEQFRAYINDMAEGSVELDNVKVDFNVLDFDGETIKMSAVGDEGVSFSSDYDFNQYVNLFDKNIRYFYLASDYSDGKKQPRIIFYDDKDDIIADNTEFIINTNPNEK